MKSSARFLLTAAVAALVVACAPGTGSLGSLPPVPSSPSPPASAEPSAPDVTPGPTSTPTSPASSPGSSPSSGPTSRPTASPVETVVVRAYFLLGDSLVPVLREVPKTAAVGGAAIDALLGGPNQAEQNARIGSAIPAGSQLLGLTIKDRLATVDLSSEFESGGGSASMFGRLAQVVYTLTQFPTVDSVAFRIEGRAVTVFSAEGITLDGPQSRADYDGQLAAIWVDRPAWGAAFGNPGRVTGSANVFEAEFRVAVLDASGRVLVDQPVMATCGTGCRGTFDVTLRYDVARAQYGTLRVYEPSAKDGSPINVREYRVWLTPA